jgi:KDO2-lipid IV(A) lauroyltransferase
MAETSLSYDAGHALPAPRSDRPVTLKHWAEYAAARALLGFFRVIGIDRASAFSGRSLRFLGPRLRFISKRAEDNMRQIFPEWGEEKIRAVVKDAWENLGRTAAEYAHLDKLRLVGERPRIVCEGAEKAINAANRRGGAVFVTGHFANWEVAGVTARQLQLRFGIIYRALNNPLLDGLIIKKRGAAITRRQIPKGMAGVRPMIDLLKDGYSIALLSDQKLNNGGLAVPFMGAIAMTSPAAARVALRYGLPIVPVATERLGGAHFRVVIRDPIAARRTGDLHKDVEALTIKINEALEREIRARPGQWLWFHRRWPKDE